VGRSVRLGEGRWRAAREDPNALIEHLEGVDELRLRGGGGVNVVGAGEERVGAWWERSEDRSERKTRSRVCRSEFESRARRRRQVGSLSRDLRGGQTSSHAERVGVARGIRRATHADADAGGAARPRYRGWCRIVQGCGRSRDVSLCGGGKLTPTLARLSLGQTSRRGSV